MHNLWGRSKWDSKERKSCGNLSAVKRRKDNVFRRLAGQLEDLDKKDVHWYLSCYSSYTSNQNIRYAIRKVEPSIVEHSFCKEKWTTKGKKRLKRGFHSQPQPELIGRDVYFAETRLVEKWQLCTMSSPSKPVRVSRMLLTWRVTKVCCIVFLA